MFIFHALMFLAMRKKVTVFRVFFFFFFKQKTAYEMLRSLVGSEMCIRDRVDPEPDTNRPVPHGEGRARAHDHSGRRFDNPPDSHKHQAGRRSDQAVSYT